VRVQIPPDLLMEYVYIVWNERFYEGGGPPSEVFTTPEAARDSVTGVKWKTGSTPETPYYYVGQSESWEVMRLEVQE
jgi:hypothetical protein